MPVQALVGMGLLALHKYSEACFRADWSKMQQDSPVAISPEKWRETFGIVATVLPFCFPFLPIFFFLLFNSRVQVILCFMHGTSAPSTFVSSSPLAEIWVQPKEFPTATHIQYLSV